MSPSVQEDTEPEEAGVGILVCPMYWGSHSLVLSLPPPHYSLQGAQLTEVQQHAVRREGGPKLLLQVVGPV